MVEQTGQIARRTIDPGAWLERHASQIRLAIRTSIAVVLAYEAGQLVQVGQVLWAVITAVLVMQASLGGSLKMMIDRLIGTLGGAGWAAVMAEVLPQGDPGWKALILALVIAPPALAAALTPWLKSAPLAAVIVLFSVQQQNAAPFLIARERVTEIIIGIVVTLLVALFVFPDRAHRTLARAAARVLAALSELTKAALPDPSRGAERERLAALHTTLTNALASVGAAAEEARRERAGRLTTEPEPEPLRRTLARLRQDLAMIGRAMGQPLPALAAGPLATPLSALATNLAGYFSDSGLALTEGRGAPPVQAMEAAFDAVQSSVANLRDQGIAATLPAAAMSQFFALAFALEQLRSDLEELAERVDAIAGQARNSAKKIT
jgi:uncharacterized membrane protein YccC